MDPMLYSGFKESVVRSGSEGAAKGKRSNHWGHGGTKRKAHDTRRRISHTHAVSGPTSNRSSSNWGSEGNSVFSLREAAASLVFKQPGGVRIDDGRVVLRGRVS
jgi:hypothetical protein